jgi:hypothetical protein
MYDLKKKLRWLREISNDLNVTILAIYEEIETLSPDDKLYKTLYEEEIKKLVSVLKEKSNEIIGIEKQLEKIVFIEDYE